MAQNVTVTLDSSSKGIDLGFRIARRHYESLPEKTKRYLQDRIPKNLKAEHKFLKALYFSIQSTNTLNIALGKAYDEADPTAMFISSMNAT